MTDRRRTMAADLVGGSSVRATADGGHDLGRERPSPGTGGGQDGES